MSALCLPTLVALTCCRAKESMQLEGEQGVRQLSQPLLEQSRELHWVLLGEIDARRVLVECLCDLLQPPDVAVFPEDPLDGHVCEPSQLHGHRGLHDRATDPFASWWR